MSIKAAILSVLFASSALAAPASSLETRQSDRCDAHIYVDSSHPIEYFNPTWKWRVEIVDSQQNQVGGWEATNPKDIYIMTSKGKNFVIEGKPETQGEFGAYSDDSFRDSITLSYDTQKWNGKDCRHFVNKSARSSNGQRNQFDWWCTYDC